MKHLVKIATLTAIILVAPCYESDAQSTTSKAHTEAIAFTSSDIALEKVFQWAHKTALSYAHDDKADPVGAWYEAALPQREAFCMRDVAHQTVGAQIIGLGKHNRNIMQRFAENITQEKDWCSYWEINRYNLPAPIDYANDREFWYNLNANADITQACLKLYEWTADTGYLKDPALINFYQKSFNEYIQHWQLEPERIMDRPQYMHTPTPFDSKNSFHTCRGLASYVENFHGLTVGADLISTLYGGSRAYATLSRLNGKTEDAEAADQLADRYRNLLETRWWNPATSTYHTFWTAERTFDSGEGEPFILWFGAPGQPDRIRGTLKSILAKEWNVENLSFFPALLYRFLYAEEAYNKLTALPYMNRSEYPEVSFGAIEGVVSGVMGLNPQASKKYLVITLPQLPKNDDWAEVTNVPVFGGTVSVRHTGNQASKFVNSTGRTVSWQASFKGKHSTMRVNDRVRTASFYTDEVGNTISYVNVKIKNGKAANVQL